MFDASYYEEIRGRARAALISVERSLERAQVSMLDELIDHNESGVAIEMMTAMLAESHASLTAEQSAQIERLVREMGLNESVARQAQAMVAPG